MSLPPATGAVELESFMQHTARLLAQRKRLDGRSFDAIRAPNILRDTQDGALASVLYTDATGTCVSCIVTGVFGPPPPTRPDEGRLTVNVTAPFLAAYGGGGGGGRAVAEALGEVAHFVRAVLESCVDLSSLSVLPGEACWVLRAELALLNADGGLRAAALHAAVAALCGLALPAARLPNGAAAEPRPLRLRAVPVAASVAFAHTAHGAHGAHGEVWAIADPSAAEECAADGLATIAVDETGAIVAVVHSGRCPITAQTLMRVVGMIEPHAETIRHAILGSKKKI